MLAAPQLAVSIHTDAALPAPTRDACALPALAIAAQRAAGGARRGSVVGRAWASTRSHACMRPLPAASACQASHLLQPRLPTCTRRGGAAPPPPRTTPPPARRQSPRTGACCARVCAGAECRTCSRCLPRMCASRPLKGHRPRNTHSRVLARPRTSRPRTTKPPSPRDTRSAAQPAARASASLRQGRRARRTVCGKLPAGRCLLHACLNKPASLVDARMLALWSTDLVSWRSRPSAPGHSSASSCRSQWRNEGRASGFQHCGQVASFHVHPLCCHGASRGVQLQQPSPRAAGGGSRPAAQPGAALPLR